MAVATESPNLITLAEGVVQRLISLQQPDGNLRDPVSDIPLPPDHYGTVLFAAACTLTGSTAGAPEAAERAIRYYLRVPRSARAAHELNNLGLLRVYRRWRGSSVAPDLQTAIAAHLHRMPFASLTSNVTNNWHAMRAVCFAQRSRLFGSERDRRAALACLHSHVLVLQGSDGLFADYPAPGRGGDRATPLTYHAKFCAMLAMFLQEIDDEAAAAALARGVSALARLCAPNGESLYFGRGCNSVYGYASAVYGALHALDCGVVAGADRNLVAQAATRMANLLLRMRQPSGSVRAYPTQFECERLGWDDFVHRLDYNAFAAFLLLQTPGTQLRAEVPCAPAGFDAPQAGLLARERDGVFAAFSIRGQLNTGSYLFSDARYTGMQPLTLQYSGRTIIPPPPHDPASPADPSWIGFMPALSVDGQIWAVRAYDEVRISDGNFVAIAGRGTPVALQMGLRRRLAKAARESAVRPVRAVAARWMRPLSRRLRMLMPPAYTVIPVPGVQVRRAMILLPWLRCLCLVERVDGRFDAGWSTIRLAGQCRPGRDGHRFHCEGLEAKVWTSSPSADPEVRQVFTSNGPASVLRWPIAPGIVHVSAVCFGPEAMLRVAPTQGSQIVLTVRARDTTHFMTVDLDTLRVTGE